MPSSGNQGELVPLSIPCPENEYPAYTKADRIRKSRINKTSLEIMLRTREHGCLVIGKQAKTDTGDHYRLHKMN